MVKTMKAAVVRGFGEPLVIEELPVPEVGPGKALVKIVATEFARRTFSGRTVTGRVKRGQLHSRARGVAMSSQ